MGRRRGRGFQIEGHLRAVLPRYADRARQVGVLQGDVPATGAESDVKRVLPEPIAGNVVSRQPVDRECLVHSPEELSH